MTKKRDPIALLKKYPDRKFSTTELIDTLSYEYEIREEAFGRLLCIKNGEAERYEGEEKDWEHSLERAIEAFEMVKKVDLLAWETFEYLGDAVFSYKKIEIPKIRRKVAEAKITITHRDSIRKAIEENFELDKWYPSIELKEFFTNLFKDLNIPIKAKSTNVEAFYEAEFKKLRIDGIQTAGVRLIAKLPEVRPEKIICSKKAKEEKGTE